MTATRSIVTGYFNHRLRNQIITDNRLLSLVIQIAADCETAYHSQNEIFHFHISSSSSSLNHIQSVHHEMGIELFNNENITWTRIISFISFSAILAEMIIEKQPQNEDLIIASFIDWTANLIDGYLHLWLEQQHYWSNFLNACDQPSLRHNFVPHYATIFRMFTFTAWYLTKN